MITRGGINLNISESNWDSLFKSLDEKERAEKILNALLGMSVFSAKEMLDTCKKLIEFTIPHTAQEQKALVDKINTIFDECFPRTFSPKPNTNGDSNSRSKKKTV